MDECSLFICSTYELGESMQVTTSAFVGILDWTSMPVSTHADECGGIVMVCSDLMGMVD